MAEVRRFLWRRLAGTIASALEKERLEKVKLVLEIVAIVVAGGWLAFVFVYEKFIAPAREPPAVNVTSTLALEGCKDGLASVRASITLKNVRGTTVYLLGGSSYAFTDKVEAADSDAEDFAGRIREDFKKSPRESYADWVAGENHFVAFREIHDARADWRLEPGEEESYEYRFYVNVVNMEYADRVTLVTDLWFAKKVDGLAIDWNVRPGPVSYETVSPKFMLNGRELLKDAEQEALHERKLGHRDTSSSLSLWSAPRCQRGDAPPEHAGL